MSLMVTMKVLAVIKLISVKLQKSLMTLLKPNVIVMIPETEKELKELPDKNDFVFKRSYAYAVEISSELGTDLSTPRTTLRQQHRANAPHDTSEEYYRRNLFIPFLDHITQEM